MQSPLAISIILPVVGAILVFLLHSVPSMRKYVRFVPLPSIALTMVVSLLVGFWSRQPSVVSLWQPSFLFGSVLALEAPPSLLVLALIWASVMLCTFLFRDEAPGRVSPVQAGPLLGVLAAGLLVLWSANLLTMIIAWTAYDLCAAGARIAGGINARSALRGLLMGFLATALLWAGGTLAHSATSIGLWELVALDESQLMLWSLAGVMRLSLYPFQWYADSVPDSHLLVPLLSQRILGWTLWVRIIGVSGGILPLSSWMTLLAAVGLAVSAFLAWSSRDPGNTMTWVGTALAGAVLLSAYSADGAALAVLVLGAVGVELGVAILSLRKGWSGQVGWWNIPHLIGAVSLVGIPPSVGFVIVASLLGSVVAHGQLIWGVTFFVCQLFMIPALVRWLRWASPQAVQSRWIVLARSLGLGVPALALLAAGLVPLVGIGDGAIPAFSHFLALPDLSGWLLWLVAVGLGAVIAWQEKNLRLRLGLWLAALYDLLRLEWLYDAAAGALARGVSVLRSTDEIIGGAGAVLWSILVFLVLALIWRL